MARRSQIVGLLLGVLVFPVVVAACGSDDSNEASGDGSSSAAKEGANGTLKVGVADAAPWMVLDTGSREYTGPTVTLFEAAAEKLGKTVEWVETGFSTAIPALQANQFDVIGLPLFATPERAEVIDFVPWTASGNCYVAMKDNDEINTLDDLNTPGVKMAVVLGSAIETNLKKQYPEVEAYSVTSTGTGALVDEVLSGRADVTPVDTPLTPKYVEKYPKLKAIPPVEECLENPDFPAEIVAGITKDAPEDLREALTSTATELKDQLQAEIAEVSSSESMEIKEG